MDGRYPSEVELETIRKWNIHDPHGLMDFVQSIWSDYGYFYYGKCGKISMATGGWSGNESLVYAMSDNLIWKLYWQRSERGGKHDLNIGKRKV